MQLRPQLDFQRSPATLILIAFMVALEVISTVGGQVMRDYYYFRYFGLTSDLWRFELWRPFSTTLVHGGVFHALFNLYCLALFGAMIEAWLGTWKTLGVIVFLGTTSSMFQFVLPDVREIESGFDHVGEYGGVGFSGVAYGMFGLLVVARHRYYEMYAVCDDQTVRLMLVWAIVCIPITYLNLYPVANIAHFSGLGLGFVLGKAIFDQRRRMPWLACLAAGGLFAIVTMFYCPWAVAYHGMKDNSMWFERQIRALKPEIFE